MKIKSRYSVFLSVFLAVVLVTTLASVVLAEAVLNGDAKVRSPQATDNFDGENLSVAGGGINGCSPSEISYLKWDLSNIDAEISSADTASVITLNAIRKNGATSGNLALYKVLDDSWEESTIIWDNRPPLSDSLQTIALSSIVPDADGADVVFDSPDLISYLNEESLHVGGGDMIAGDNTASMALVIEGCGGFLNSLAMGSKENGVAPMMSLFDPTAIQLNDIQGNSNSPLFYIGLIMIVVLLASFVILLYRKSTE